VVAIRTIYIDNPIPSPMTYAVEVTIELESGERRWCFFCTPDSLSLFGDLLPGSNVRVHAGSPHMIVLSAVTAETIQAAIHHLAMPDELLNASLPIEDS
jgi:hypothetical protein